MTSKNQTQRINIIIGQLNGIKTMLDNKKECSSVLIQLSAVKSAIDSLGNYIIKNNFSDCLGKSKNDKELMKIIKSLIKNN